VTDSESRPVRYEVAVAIPTQQPGRWRQVQGREFAVDIPGREDRARRVAGDAAV
jgi:hypothetical protein